MALLLGRMRRGHRQRKVTWNAQELQRGLSVWDMESKRHSVTDEGIGVNRCLDQKSRFYSSAVKRSGAKEGCGLFYILRNPSDSCAEMDGGGEQKGKTY